MERSDSVDAKARAKDGKTVLLVQSASEQGPEALVKPISFFLDGRPDLTVLGCTGNENAFLVFQNGEQQACVTDTDSLESKIQQLAAVIGWTPDCPSAKDVLNCLHPVDYSDAMMDLSAYTTGQRDVVANAANASSIVWNAFQAANRPLNWAGVYFLRPLVNPKESDKFSEILILGPFMGKPACTRIRLMSGVCGAAARTKKTQRISDVHDFPGHIACDDASQSEIVVPILDDHGQVLAVLDLDCPRTHGFSAEDERQLTVFAQKLASASDWEVMRSLGFTQ